MFPAISRAPYQFSRLKGIGFLCLLAVLVGLQGCILMKNELNPFQESRKPLEEKKVEGEGRDKVLILNVSGMITSDEEEQPLGMAARESTVARVKEALRKAEKDDDVRALLLRIDSPGGGVTASDIIYREVTRFKEKRHIPVVAALMDTAASGGYYVALSADEIVAHPTTVTGSIGVVLINLNVEGLFKKIGVADTTVKSGEHKDIGSPFRKPTASDRRILQGVIDDLYARFVERVRTSRGPIKGARPNLADGRIFTADQALKAGLIDEIGYLDDAIETAKARAGIKEASVVVYRRHDEYAENVYSMQESSRAGTPGMAEELKLLIQKSGPRFLYLWTPGWP